jgi:DNA polymerase-1
MQAGREFNINSPKQLGEVLFVELGLPYQKKKTKSGYSTDAQTLEELRYISPIIDDILEYRQVTKLKNTYADALPALADENHRIHTDFKQALTATGRLSSADPNLQNIPIKTKMGRQMRKYFITDEGYTLVDADYSQIELRLLAHIADDYNMREAFINGEDIHRKTAAAVFGLPEEAVNEEMRKRAKAVNFGIVYGISGFSLSKDIGTTVSEANKYIKNYLMNYPSIDRYLDEVVEDAKKNGYTTTVHGRRRYIPELTAQNAIMRGFGKRVAMNAPIQGSAADIMKIAMIRTYNRLKAEGLDARIVMQVHDELIVEAKDSQVEAVKQILREEMEGSAELSIPLTVDVSTGKNWLDQE